MHDRRRRTRRQQPNANEQGARNGDGARNTPRPSVPPAPVSAQPPATTVTTQQPIDASSAQGRFSDLTPDVIHPTLIKTIIEDLKFEDMTTVQAATIRELLPPARSDCLVRAKTGTGKTLAFLIPALHALLTNVRPQPANGHDPAVSILVISPTRELAQQIANDAQGLLQRLPEYRVCTAIGGTNKNVEERKILKGPDVLIATPGRLLDHLANEDVKYLFRRLDTIVLDEADRLLDMGFLRDLKNIVSYLPDKAVVPRQGMLFSATIGEHVDSAAKFILNPGYKKISTIPEGEASTHQRVPQLLVKVNTFSDVAPALVGCIRQEAKQTPNFKAIVFAPTAAHVKLYESLLAQIPDLPPVSSLSSRLTQNRRTQITNDYRSASTGILVATDVIARGMDFPNVSTVFQVGIPSEKESYIHRLGRTGRAGAEGRGIFIVTEAEEFFPKWQLKDVTFVPSTADLSAAGTVSQIASTLDEDIRAKAYQAWLGYYKGHMKPLRWDNAQLVAEANTFARDGLQCPETPGIPKTTVGKMGLRGTKGLVVVPDPPRQNRQGHGQGGRAKQAKGQ